ncbi:MAG: glycosyltransferase [Dysgonamonadaceae bacterium]|jgi:glycosyltransferase|nr:glycosyltransferase [Dysgonamonadaceae bacterium]
MKKRKIFIFTRNSRAAAYGIGTYIKTLVTLLKNSDLDFGLIRLYSGGREATIEEKEGYRQISIPYPAVASRTKTRKQSLNGDFYDRNVAFLLRALIPYQSDTEYVFQFNFMGGESLARHLKKEFHGRILLVVHYTDWSFELLGDFNRIKTLSLNKLNEKRILKRIKEDFKLVNTADRVVFIAGHTLRTFKRLGGIGKQNYEIINNALKDSYFPVSQQEKTALRKKYLIGENEKIVFFAGRLDEEKGLRFLIEAFKRVLLKYPEARLFIAGTGGIIDMAERAAPYWSKISFTGKLDRTRLYEFYSLADIGVICSLHEEFGLVALEMMMFALPLVATKTSGLDELIEDGVSGLKVPLVTVKGLRQSNVKVLSEKIIYLLDNPSFAKTLGENARKRYLEKYNLELFFNKMTTVYNTI